MEELVKVIKNEVFTDSLIIAQGTENQHESVQRRIRAYEKEITSYLVWFGLILFGYSLNHSSPSSLRSTLNVGDK